MKHTPGPWKSSFGIKGQRIVRNEGGLICTPTKPSRYSGQDERYESELKEYEANAKLIAAAPELLEVLQAIQGIELWITDPEMKKLFKSKVYPVIKKATQ